MLAVITCLGGIGLILVAAELLWQKKMLRGEHQRKFVHILSAVFMASWPWLISFKTIQLIGISMIAFLLINRRLKQLHYHGNTRHQYYGDIFLALGVITSAMLTTNKVFFATAMIELSLADGLAAVIGSEFKDKWHYKVLGQTKTVIGTMVFWLISLAVLATGMLFTNGLISEDQYGLAILLVPPLLTLLENVAIQGLDNLAVPAAVVIALRIVS